MQPEHYSVSRVSLGEVLLILFLEVGKYLAQMGGLVGYVFHDMRGVSQTSSCLRLRKRHNISNDFFTS